MNTLIDSIVNDTVQCWGCRVFDRLFQVISAATAAVYEKIAFFAVILLCVFVAFYVLHSVITNLRSAEKIDPTYESYFKPVIINALFVVAILGLGVMIPRFITTVTFEPVADVTLIYTQSMLNTDQAKVDEKVEYVPETMPDDGFYRPQLRDKIIMLMKTSITQFQAMMKLGMIIMDSAFSWNALLGIFALVKHIIIFFMGLYITWAFFKLFIKFCFYFVDVIIDMTFFAFFFPFMLVLWVFKNSKSADWVKNMSKKITPTFFKNLINSIVSLATVVITYVIIMVVMAKFFTGSNSSSAELTEQIMNGTIFAGDLSDDNLTMVTLFGVLVLVYIVQYLASNISQVSKAITDTFEITDIHTDGKSAGETMGEDALKIGKNTFDFAKNTGKILWSAATGKESDKKEENKEASKTNKE
ncbi:MAG: hypothetical protein ACOX7D_00440 [Alphaproteobacteria bacterium]|jgi:hypothetical protein